MPSRSSRTALPSPTAIRKVLTTARRVAQEMGTYVSSRHKRSGRDAMRKGEGDFVTEVDLASERKIRAALAAAHPEHTILGEEEPPHQLGHDFAWILDPIDGTSNFAHGLPHYAVSIACLFRGSPVAAALACYPEGVVYSAGKGLGAFRGRQRLTMPKGRLDDAAILAVQWHRGTNDLPYLPELVRTGARVRNYGCTVTHLCDVAAGRLQGNIQEQGKIWDFAAAALVVTEAGGVFSDWRGDPIFPIELDGERHHPSVAAAKPVHRRLVELLGPHFDRVQKR